MFSGIDDKIKKIINTDQLFSFFVEAMGYDCTTQFVRESEDIDFDATYSTKFEDEEFVLLGIKIVKDLDETKLTKLHLSFWNRNDVPFSILILPGEIRIYNNFSIENDKLLYRTGDRQENVLEMFSNRKIINGSLWEKYKQLQKKEGRVDRYLLRNMRNTIINLHSDYEMELDDAYNFLAQCIFVKYLEDREMLTQKAFLLFGVHTFDELLSLHDTNMIKKFFIQIKEWFNGDLFDVDNIVMPTNQQLRVIKSFFDADEIEADGTVQLTLYKYDFSKIPIELISNIYETFFNLEDEVTKNNYSSKNGAFYTPYYLSEFMIDRSMRDYQNENIPVVLDPACGSGVFLVGAFKKIVKTACKNGGTITADELGEILTEKIFGIDKNIKALKLACFSLYIALLEYLTPKDILENEFKFPNLIGRTLYEKNFFDCSLDDELKCADIIIGNPPWVSDQGTEHNLYCKKNNIPISDKQIAQAFIVRAKDFAKPGAVISLIVTNSIFINENAEEFRKYLLKGFRIKEVINLSGVKASLFSHAKAPCSILTYSLTKETTTYDFDFFSFQPNIITDIFEKIVFDYDRLIRINRDIACENSYVWRILNHGDEYDVRVINRMKLFPTVSDRGYKYFRGYVVGTKKKKHVPEFLGYKGGNLQSGFFRYGINYADLPQMQCEEFERPRKLEDYLCECKLLVKRTQNKKLSGAAFCKEPIIFSDDYHCIYDPENLRMDDLKILEAFFNSSLFKYYCFTVGKVAVSIKPELSKDDILSFPVPQDISSMNQQNLLKLINEIEDLTKELFKKNILKSDKIYQEIECKQKKIDEIVYSSYGFDSIERETISYALKYLIDRDKTYTYMDENDLNVYICYVEKYFNNFLREQGLQICHQKVCKSDIYTMIAFSVCTKEVSYVAGEGIAWNNIVDLLGLSSITDIGDELLIKEKLTGFYNDGFFVIKTNEVHNWTLMSAIKDSDYFTKLILREEDNYE